MAMVASYDDGMTTYEIIQRDPRVCKVCGGDLEKSDQEPEAGYLHVNDENDDHTPVLAGEQESAVTPSL